jgi:outer membrane protein insertion porin family
MIRRARALLAAGAMLAAAGAAPAGAASPTVVEVELASPHQLPREPVLAAIGPLAGRPLSRGAVRESLSRLWALGLFDAISVDGRAQAAGVRLVYHLRRRPWLARLAWRGDLGLDRADIATATRLAPDGDADDATIARARERVLALLRREGYLGAQVEAIVVEQPATNGRDLTVSIAAGRPARIGRVSATGTDRVPAGDVIRAFDLEAGVRYRERSVQESAEAATRYLRELGFLDGRVAAAASRWDAATNRVGVELRVSEGPEYRVTFSGNSALGDRELARRADLATQGPIDSFVLDTAAHAVEAAYRERGYALARVTAAMEETKGTETRGADRSIRFDVHEGPRVIVAGVNITGSTEIPPGELLDQMNLKPGRWFSTPFRADLLEADVRTLQAFVRARGFAGATVGPPHLIWSEDQGEVRIAIPVVEGPRLRVGAISIEGAALVPTADLLAALPLSTGGAWDVQRVDEGIRAIDQLYRRRGAFGTDVTADTRREGGAVDVTYRIVEGPQTRIGRVLVRGALLTRDSVIRERLPFGPGDLLDPDRLVKGGSQLTDLGVFERVDVEPLDPPATPFADVEVTVRERKPWRFDFGVGYATDEGGRGYAEIGYENLFGTGRGLRLRQKLNGGGEVSAFGARSDLIYREPWAFGTPWDGEARLFWEYREALGYNFERAGLLATMAGDLWPERVRGLRGSAWYRFYEIRRFDIDPDLADSTIVPGRNRVASVAGSLTWDLRDAPLDPHRGSLHFASLETAAEPLGGNVSFVKGRLETAWAFSWLPPTVLALAARLGLATPFGGSTDLPIEDRFYAGGANTVRGYREQRVGPLDANGDPLGGNALVVLNAEWRFPIWRFIGASVFVDAGTVTPTVSDLSLGSVRVGVGGGLRLNTPVGPVRFDFGYALTPIPGENRFQFYVALGNPF